MWLTIIESILAVVGPLLEKALFAWLAQALHIAALDSAPPLSTVPQVGSVIDPTASDRANKLSLLDKVRSGLWFWQFGKKSAVDAAIARVKLS